MSSLTTVSLNSARYAEATTETRCYVCGQKSITDIELCSHCFAPMALTSQAVGQKTEPLMLAVIGSAGVGKTVYLGMLMDMLSRQQNGLKALARGAFSVSLQQTTAGALSRCEFPAKTPNEPDRWNWVHCQLDIPKSRKPCEVVVPDPAGEAVLEELEHPNTYPALKSVLAKCRGILLLIDSDALQSGGREQEYFAMKVLSYLNELDPRPKQGWPNRPVGIIFSKADRCDTCQEGPQRYAEKRIGGVWHHCQERFHRHRFFACGVAGEFGQRVRPRHDPVATPLRIEPHGIVEPFAWLIENLQK